MVRTVTSRIARTCIYMFESLVPGCFLLIQSFQCLQSRDRDGEKNPKTDC